MCSYGKIDVTRRNTKPKNVGMSEVNSIHDTTDHVGGIEKFHGSQGHGFAAEQGNTLIDKLYGKDATVVGDDNAKDGADRLVDGQLIQTKYCQTASQSVAAAFENDKYRYLDSNGEPMQLEVPADQYEAAVEEMRKRIAKGQVPGHTDPKDAEKLVRKGNLTYKQSVNIAKAGTVESLIFDAANGAVIAANAFGITATVTFAKSIWEGKSVDVAIEKSLCAGLKVGGVAFTTTLLTSQLAKSGLHSLMKEPSKTVVKALMKNKTARNVIVEIVEKSTGKAVAGSQVANKAAKLLRGNVIANAVLITVMSANDIRHAFSGKISGKQLFKNVTTLVAGMTGASGGAFVGEIVCTCIPVPGATAIGFYVGGAIGGAVGGSQTNKALSKFIEDDSIKMVRILEGHFVDLVDEYYLSQEEIDIILDNLRRELSNGTLLEMFASDDRDQFADDLLRKVIEHLISNRALIYMPSQQEYLNALDRLEERARNGQVLIDDKEVDPVEIGEKLLGKKIDDRAAKKAWYITRQSNTTNLQAEVLLRRAQEKEKSSISKREELSTKREEYRKQFNALLDSESQDI